MFDGRKSRLTFLNTRWTNLDELKDLISWYYDRGIVVFPLRPLTKEPSVSWKEFQTRKPSYTEVIQLIEETVHHEGEDINLATLTGSVYGYVVVDVDNTESWEKLLSDLRIDISQYRYWKVNTGKGFHLYFRYPDEVIVPNIVRLNKLGYHGVEILGEGHIVVIPPSVHPDTGTLYQWDEDFSPPYIHPEDLSLLPQPLLNIVINRETKPNGNGDTVVDTSWTETVIEILSNHWVEGQRHNLTLAVTGILRKHEVPYEVVKNLIETVVQKNHDLEGKDRIRVVEDTYRKPPEFVAGYRLLSEIVGQDDARQILRLLPTSPQERRKMFPVRFEMSDVGNAQLILAYFGSEIIYDTCEGHFMFWDGKKFVPERLSDRQFVHYIIDVVNWETQRIQNDPSLSDEEREERLKWLKKLFDNYRIRQCRDILKQLVAVTPNKLDADHFLTNTQNGVLDLRTRELYPHHPSFLLTKIVSANYDPDADCPRFKEFLREISCDDDSWVEFIQRVFGYCLSGDVSEEKVFFFYGVGANGKTTLLRIIKGVLGSYAKTVSADIIKPHHRRGSTHPEIYGSVRKIRLAEITEWDEESPVASSLVKMLTTPNEISTREIGGRRYEFFPTHKLFISTNHPPKVKDLSFGLFRRLVIVPFDYIIPVEKQNPRLVEEILNEERDGIFNWLVEGWKRYQELRLNITCKRIEEEIVDFRSSTDVVYDWIRERCVLDPEAMTPFPELYEDFRQWFIEVYGDEEDVIGKSAFSKLLEAKKIRTVRVGKTNKTFKKGIRLKNPDEINPPSTSLLTDVNTPSETETTSSSEDDDDFPF